MAAIDYLIYLPVIAVLVLFWYFGSKIMRAEPTDFEQVEDKGLYTDIELVEIDTHLSEREAEEELNRLIGKKIENVYYINLNHPDYEFEAFDSIDGGVIIQLEGGQFINWLFHEDYQDWERGKNIQMGYYIDFSNKMSELKIGDIVFKVSTDEKWRKFIGFKIKSFDLKRVGIEGNMICEKLLIETITHQKVGILSTNEPRRIDENIIDINLDFGIDWITVVFNEEYL